MKICGVCGEKKALSEFADNRAKPDGKQYQCRSCQKEYRRRHYEKNKGKILGQVSKRKQELRDYIWSVKCKAFCMDCDESDPVVLEFDHLRDKEFNVGKAVDLGYSRERVAREIEKCDIVCANCHRRRTFGRGGWVRNVVIEAP